MPTQLPLRSLLVDQLKDLASAEQQLLEALPKMARAASADNLKQGFLDHLAATQLHADRLAKAAKLLGETPATKTCVAMKGLIAEGNEAIELDAPDAVRDLALLGAALRVEHYEIAAYTAARGIAGALNEAGLADLLQQTLDEEHATEKQLGTMSDLVLETATQTPSPKTKDTPRGTGKKKTTAKKKS